MTNLHYYARIRKNGQITIPHQLREELGLKEGTIIELIKENDRIILKTLPPEKAKQLGLLKTLQEIDNRSEKRKTKIDSITLIREDRERQD